MKNRVDIRNCTLFRVVGRLAYREASIDTSPPQRKAKVILDAAGRRVDEPGGWDPAAGRRRAAEEAGRQCPEGLHSRRL